MSIRTSLESQIILRLTVILKFNCIVLSVVDDVSVDSVTSVITLLILKICRLNHMNRIYVRAFIELSVRTIRVFELYHIIFFKNKLMTCGRIMNPRTDKTLQSPRFWRSCIQVHVFFRDVLVSFFIVIYYKIKKCKLDDSPSSPKTANQSGKQQRKPQEF